jgi:hypothetical protein
MNSFSKCSRDFAIKIKSFTIDNLIKFSVEKAKETLIETIQAALKEEALEFLGVKRKGEDKKSRI